MAFLTVTIGTGSNTVAQLTQMQAPDTSSSRPELNALENYLARCSSGNESIQALSVTINQNDPNVNPDYAYTVSSANATAGAIYTSNSQAFTVGSTISSGTSLTATGTGTPATPAFSFTVTDTNYQFTVTAANATAGATYTNNTQTFTVLTTISGGTTLLTSGTGAPLSSGTLTKTSGTGDATITFSVVSAVGANATTGAVYSNNGQNYTVSSTISLGATLSATGASAPASSGVLTKVSGTGDATITFSSASTTSVLTKIFGTGDATIAFSSVQLSQNKLTYTIS